MLDIKCQEYLDDVKAKATELGLMDKLQESLDYLDTYAGERGRVELYLDFAPLSFGIGIYLNGQFAMAGGLIFYGSVESGAGDPQFSVSTSGRSDARWEVHT